MKNFNDMIKQAQKLQQKVTDMQTQLEGVTMDGQAGGGLVKITISGKNDLKKIQIDPSLLKEDEKEVLEDLIVAAHNDAKNKLEAHVQDEMSKVTGGFNLPAGFKMPF